MAYVPLDRRFSPWRDENPNTEDFDLLEREFYGDVRWGDILKRQRVIVLAEAGSGKSRELEEQAKILRESGAFAFHATVQNVAKQGLDAALDASSRAQLDEWRNSEAIGTFFIDSVDEAKLDHIQFGDALRRLADGLGNGIARARLVISGRYSRWEFRADLKKVEEHLPIPKVSEGGDLDSKQLIASILRNQHRQRAKEAKPEKTLVVLMAPLDKEQVRLFAAGLGVEHLDEFMAALARENLWHLAKRPLDLGWLVDYWQEHKRFGRLVLMLEASIQARLREENPTHGDRDEIDEEKAFAALERIGATMVFGRGDRIEIPDTELSLGGSRAFKLKNILPDWPSDHLPKLLARPVFDPAGPGQVRLHNDNDGVVRGYLTARWLKARLDGNVSMARVRSLLFAEADGVPIVIPSTKETAAWLAIWEEEIALEIIERDPVLLLTAGDPSSLSLEVRSGAIDASFKQLASGVERYSMLDFDTLRRFATNDILPALKSGWQRYGNHQEVRRLILMMIDAGGLADGVDLAREAVAGAYPDRTTFLYGMRALGSVGGREDRAAIAGRLRTEAKSLDPSGVWEGLSSTFPDYLSIADFVRILRVLAEGEDRSHHFDWRGKQLVEGLKSRAQLKELTEALLPTAREEDEAAESAKVPRARESKFKPLLQTAALGLLKLLPVRTVDPAIVDAAVQIAADRYTGRRYDEDEFRQLLQASPERRRIGLWRAVELLKDHPRLMKIGLSSIWQLDLVGWSAGLREEDLSWLLEDANDGDTPLKRRLALDGLLSVWREIGKPEDLLAQIKDAAEKDQVTSEWLDAWLQPPKQDPEENEHLLEMARMRKEHEEEEAQRDKSWFDFIDSLRADPEQLRTPPPNLQPGYVDSRIYGLWQLLYAASEERTGWAIDDFGVLGDLLGPKASEEAKSALINFWRTHEPTLTSSRKPGERNMTHNFDSMGIASIALEARRDANWANGLSSTEASKAAKYATIELNGFPGWISQLAEVWPDEVTAVFVGEAMDHLSVAPEQHGFLDKVGYADPALAKLVAPAVLSYLQDHAELSAAPLSKAFKIIKKSLPDLAVPPGFVDAALQRFIAGTDFGVMANYLGFVLRVAPEQGVVALSVKLDALSPEDQVALAEHVMPALFGDGWSSRGAGAAALPFDVLERLVGIAFRTIRHEDDEVHHGVYSPGLRDHAEGARGSLFKQLYETPGRETLEALRRMAAEPNQSIPRARLEQLIYERASVDAEHDRWPASEAYELEREFDPAPRTPRDLQLVALARLTDLNHDLHHHRFNQGQAFKRLPKERDVQKWLAWEIEKTRGRAFSLEREPHVADEKEPDVRLQSQATNASLPLEIKVAESWSLKELEDAVTVQLAGRYLRERDQGHGVLIVAHQLSRSEGWEDEQRKMLSFEEVVARLRALAHQLGAGGKDAAQVEIAVIDVSDIEIPEQQPKASKPRARRPKGAGKARSSATKSRAKPTSARKT